MVFCSVCFGDPASPLTHGYNYAVFFMLAMVAVVLTVFATVFLKMRKRMRNLASQ